MSRSHSASCLVVCCWIALSARADWPHLRGPKYDGVSAETELAESFGAQGPQRLWSRPLGQGHSGIVVAGGKLCTQYQTTAGQYVVCLAASDGAVIWEQRIDRPWQAHGAYPGPYATPTIAADVVLYASPTGKVGCVKLASGEPVWSVDLPERFGGRGFDFGYAATPLVEDGRVILPVGGPEAALVALDAANGKTLWTAGADRASYCPALPLTFRDRRCVLGYLENALLIVEMSSGKVLHRSRRSSGYDEHSAWPLYAEPHVVLSGPFRAGATCLELTADDDETLSLRPRWSCRKLSNDIASSVLYRGSIYGFDLSQPQASAHRPSRGAFRCIDFATGAVRWSTDHVGHAGLVAADGKLYLLNDSGTLVVARADPDAYEELARLPVFGDEICWTPPTLDGGRLFVRSPGQLACLWIGGEDAQSPLQSEGTPPHSRSWRPDASWFVSVERDFPNDAPTLREAWLWFATSSGLLALAAALTSRQLFVAATFGLGLLGPNLLSAIFGQLLFTWPLSLYAALLGAVNGCRVASVPRCSSRDRWASRVAVTFLVGVCGAYFFACKAAGVPIAWSFLVGLPVAAPFAALSSKAATSGHRWVALGWNVMGFAALFGAGIGFLALKGLSP